MGSNRTVDEFYRLADRWSELSTEASERAARLKKGSPLALYERINAETLQSAAQELRAALKELGPTYSQEQLVSRLEALYALWEQRSMKAKDASAKSSTEGAKHVGTALGLDKVMADFAQFVQKPKPSA